MGGDFHDGWPSKSWVRAEELTDGSSSGSQRRSVSGTGSRLKSGRGDGTPILSHIGFLSIWIGRVLDCGAYTVSKLIAGTKKKT